MHETLFLACWSQSYFSSTSASSVGFGYESDMALPLWDNRFVVIVVQPDLVEEVCSLQGGWTR